MIKWPVYEMTIILKDWFMEKLESQEGSIMKWLKLYVVCLWNDNNNEMTGSWYEWFLKMTSSWND